MPYQTLEAGEFVTRHAEARIRVALTDTRIVAVVGPRRSGKATLVRRIAEHDEAAGQSPVSIHVRVTGLSWDGLGSAGFARRSAKRLIVR